MSAQSLQSTGTVRGTAAPGKAQDEGEPVTGRRALEPNVTDGLLIRPPRQFH